ncbi:MAG: hypothetical protein ACM3ZC_09510 [Bacteroidota bacterium]
MGHEDDRQDERPARAPGSTRRRTSTRKPVEVQGNFITKDDLSQFLSIKPYLSDKAQAIVDLLAELEKSAGKLEIGALGKLVGLFGGDNANLAALTSLAGMAGGGGKLDPTALVSLLGTLGQGSLGQGLLGQGKEK